MKAVSMAPSMMLWATWMPRGPSSRAMLCASARSACLAPAKAAKLAAPRSVTVASAVLVRGGADDLAELAGEGAKHLGGDAADHVGFLLLAGRLLGRLLGGFFMVDLSAHVGISHGSLRGFLRGHADPSKEKAV